MTDQTTQDDAVALLQQLGLKEYEAKSFVALTRLPQGTAKDIGDISEVPRTRVYDAVRVLQSKGLVEVQHGNPQRFRAVSIAEAVETLRSEYDERIESLRQTLQGLEPAAVQPEEDATHEVWALSGGQAITTRTQESITEADQEVVMVIGDDSFLDAEFVESLQAAHERGVSVIVGTISEALRAHVQDALPDVEVFVSGLEWLNSGVLPGDDTELGRLLLVDRETILVSTFTPGPADGRQYEQAVFGHGFDNGLVTVARRLLVTGLLPSAGPGTGDSEGWGQ